MLQEEGEKAPVEEESNVKLSRKERKKQKKAVCSTPVELELDAELELDDFNNSR